MISIIRNFRRLNQILFTLAVGGASVLMVFLVGVVVVSVFFRYVLGAALSWSEEVSRYTMVWLALLGAAAAVRQWDHFRMEVVEQALPQRLRRITAAGSYLAVLLLALVLFRDGITFVGIVSHQLSSAAELPMGWVFASIPVSAALMILFALERLLSLAVGGEGIPDALLEEGQGATETA